MSDDDDDIGESHRQPMLYCVFCRCTLPPLDWYDGCDYHESGELEDYWQDTRWNLSFWALSRRPIHAEDGTLMWHYSSTKVTNGDWSCSEHYPLICLDGPSCHVCNIEEPVFYVHQDCWMAARRQRPGLNVPKTLDLACATQPMLDWRFLQIDSHINRHIPVVSWNNLRSPFPDTELSRILRRVAQKLPGQLQDMIIEQLRGTLLFSLLTTLSTLRLVDLVTPRGPPGVLNPVNIASGREAFAAIKIESIDLYGQMYIRRLEFSSYYDQGSHSIQLKDKAIKGLTYGLGDFGLRAVRAEYVDGTCSPWLGDGDEDSGWYGTIEGNNPFELHAVQDDLRIIRLLFDEIENPSRTRPCRALWDRLDVVGEQSGVKIARMLRADGDDGARRKGTSRKERQIRAEPQILGHPGYFLARHLDMSAESLNGTASTITVFCNDESTTGILHGTKLLGYRSGIAITFSLRPDEHIRSIYLWTDRATTSGVQRNNFYIGFGTSLGHFHPCGLWLPSSTPMFGSRSRHAVLARELSAEAIFVDHLRDMGQKLKPSRWPASSFPLTTLGICYRSDVETQTDNGGPFVLHHPPQHVYDSLPRTGEIVTTAALLRNVKSLQTQERHIDRFEGTGPRMGLLVRYQDDKPDCYLGQWDPSERLSITKIYDHEHGELQSLCFRIDETLNDRLVVSISVNQPPSSERDSESDIFTSSEEIYIKADELATTPLSWLFDGENDIIVRVAMEQTEFDPWDVSEGSLNYDTEELRR